MHEIVTLQFGQQSNYLGTHFWNTQESYFTYPPEPESPVNHDILFRGGIAPDGSDTFTPRALIYDLKGAFGSMKKVNALYEPEEDANVTGSNVWPAKPIIQRTQPIPQSAYQTHLDAGLNPPQLTRSAVRFWSDYSRVYFHPKSLIQLSEFDVNDGLMPFEKWEVGMELFEKSEREADLVDRDLRPFIEECDQIQGLQIFTGVDDAWGGWASGWLERLRDEYGKMSIWTWALGDQGSNTSVPRERRLQQLVNASRSLHVLAEHSSIYVPVSNNPAKTPSYLQLDSNSPWHIGAMQALALESITIPSRLRSSDERRGTLQDLEETINSTGKRRIAKLEMSIADPDVLDEKSERQIAQAEKSGSMGSGLDDKDGEQLFRFDIDVFSRDYRGVQSKPFKKEHIFSRVESTRGDWNLAEHGRGLEPHDRYSEGPTVQRYVTYMPVHPAHQHQRQIRASAHLMRKLSSRASHLTRALQYEGATLAAIESNTYSCDRYSAPLLFPLLDSFPPIFDVGGGKGVKLAVYAGLTTSTAVAEQVRSVEQVVRRMISLDEREALCNGLHALAEEYDEGWDSGSDSDGDD
ncbi:protein DML1 [Polyplosphaeria fusca]|uniref:Protein DML1 n=1 Tax=Polyplosphaeria fusca TaxID=682080 RepID=A0A9P4QPP3_9PLEO|nr:protein DML1 [Polyplosphaeria fusca]